MDFLGSARLKAHRLKVYIYDVYRFIDAKIILEELEKDIVEDISSVKTELEDFSNARTQAAESVDENTTPTQFEEKLTKFDVKLETDVSDDLEAIEQELEQLGRERQKTDPPEYHDRVVEKMEQAVEMLRNDLERNAHILNSVVERLDRTANPVEMAKQLHEFKTGQESTDLGDVQNTIDSLNNIFRDNSLHRLSGWRKMFSTKVYRSEETRNKTSEDFKDAAVNNFDGLENEEGPDDDNFDMEDSFDSDSDDF